VNVEEMEQTLDRLGIEHFSVTGDEVQAACPAHKERTGHEDRNPSFYINADSGAFICFSCQFKGNLYTLISYVEGVDLDKAKDWMGSTSNLMSRFERLVKDKPVHIEETTHVTESMLSAFTLPPADALRSRGLTVEAAQVHGLLWDARTRNWIIPIRDPYTKSLLGWQEKGYDHRRFNNTPAKVQKSKALFGFGEYSSGDMIVVESPLDVVRLTSLGITGGVAIYGAIASAAQFNLIRGSDRVIFALDNDTAGKSSSAELYKLCRQMDKEAWFFNYGSFDVKDIGGMSLDEVKYGLSNAKHYVRGEKVTR